MDINKIEQAYTQYAGVAQQAFQTLEGLVEKMQQAADNGDSHAAQWANELQQVIQTLENGQGHIGTLLQQVHSVMAAFGMENAAQGPDTSAEGSEGQNTAAKSSGVSSFVTSFLQSDLGKSFEQGTLEKIGGGFLGRFLK